MANSVQSKRLSVLSFPSFLHLSACSIILGYLGNKEFSQADRILPIPIVSQPMPPHYETIGAFVISEEAIASLPLWVRGLFVKNEERLVVKECAEG